MRSASRWMVLAAVASVGVSGCASEPTRRLRETTPCPSAGFYQTWCDDAGDCELRGSMGEVLSCDESGCAAAAVAACEGGTDGGHVDGGVGREFVGCYSVEFGACIDSELVCAAVATAVGPCPPGIVAVCDCAETECGSHQIYYLYEGSKFGSADTCPGTYREL